MKWVTRQNVHVDRVACPWLIRKFIDPSAEFLFVPAETVMDVAKHQGATPYDAKGQAELDHHDGRCSFESIIKKYGLTDAPLLELAKIVHAADVKADIGTAPEAPGLEAISRGFAALCPADEDRLEKQFPVYDALYAYCRTKTGN